MCSNHLILANYVDMLVSDLDCDAVYEQLVFHMWMIGYWGIEWF